MLKILISLFSVIVVMSNIISTKIFHLPILNHLPLPAGIIIYPISLIITDLVTELYGVLRAKQMIWIAFGMSLLSFGILEITFLLPGGSDIFKEALGKNGWIVMGSLTAYLIGQMIDVKLYACIKQWTKGRFLWIRNIGSMLIAQLIDTFIVNWIYLYLGLGFGLETVLQVTLFSYLFKVAFTVFNTPLYYFLVKIFQRTIYEPTT